MTPLAKRLADRIAASGPLTVADYMAACLGDPDHGYYTTRDPLGAAGDFVTAPEISQIFGELIGLWCADLWTQMSGPPVTLVELGPGRGTLLADALRAAAGVPGFRDATTVHLVETSPVLRRAQAATLAAYAPAWHDTLATVPPGPTLLVANEFFDALPIHQYVRGATAWHERHVAVDPATAALAFTTSTAPAPIDAPGEPGDIVERAPARAAVMRKICARIADNGGAALIVDYGSTRGADGDTLQAVRGHAVADPLADPGMCDLTSHVDFAALADDAGAAGLAVFGPTSQRHFLLYLGAATRAAALQRAAPPAQADAVAAAIQRLIAPDQMGNLFAALAVTSPRLTPSGFPAPATDTGAP